MNGFPAEAWRRYLYPALLLLNAGAGLWGLSSLHVQAAWLPLADGRVCWIWTAPLASAGTALALLLLILATGYARHRRSAPAALDHVLQPLAWMPALPLLLLMRPLVPQPMASTLALWGLAAVIAALVARTHAWLTARAAPPRYPVLGTFLLVSMLYTGVGTYFTTVAGAHSGDENHYLTMARSLRQDGDLDVRNNVRFRGDRWRDHQHISPASRGEHWYSEHPIGLPLLLWPVVDASLFWRHLVLGLMAGAGSAGMVRLALCLGAPCAAALVVAGITSLGMFWGIYASRALPEVMGAALTVWLVVGIATQPRAPWRSMVPVLLAVTVLPWAHIRFLPLSLLGFGFYGLRALCSRPPAWRPLLLRLILFTLLAGAGLALYVAVQNRMFSGGRSYAEEGLIFSLPRGIWETLASNRGILVAMPAFAWLLAATVRALGGAREHRYAHGITLALLITVLCTACATIWFSAGACLPGRFLLVVTPLLAASGATVFARVSRPARGLFLLLSGYAMALFLLWLIHLPRTGDAFVNPQRALGWFLPALGHLLDPLREPHDAGGHRFAALLYGISLLVVWRASWPRGITAALLILLAAGATISHCTRPPGYITHDAGKAAKRIGQFQGPTSRATGHAPSGAAPVFAAIDRFSGATPERTFTAVTHGLPAPDATRPWVVQAQLPTNDWAARELAWATLVSPFRVPSGPQTFFLAGTLTGRATLHVAVRNGSQTLLETVLTPDAAGRITLCRELETRQQGDLYLLARLSDGSGQFIVDTLHWAPTPPGLLQSLRLELPPAAPGEAPQD